MRRDDPTPAPWTKAGGKRIKELGLTMQVSTLVMQITFLVFIELKPGWLDYINVVYVNCRFVLMKECTKFKFFVVS